MRFLRQSTAVIVPVGPIVDKTTALPLTSLADQSANGRLVKNATGGTIAVASWSHDAQGHYLVGLSTSHTDTVGKVRLEFYDAATYLPVWEDFTVLSAAVYDSLFGTVALSTFNPASVLAAPRALDAIADAALTANDAFHCAIAASAGKEAVAGTSYVVKTPSDGTVLRTFTLDDATTPTSRS